MKVSIVDPHGHHLGDTLPKLRGMAAFAAAFGDEFHRIEAIAQVEQGPLRVLDLKQAHVRETIVTASDAETLYLELGTSYF